MADPRSATELFAATNRAVPAALADWEARLDAFCHAYLEQQPDANLFEITQSSAIFVWDMAAERVVVVYGLSAAPRDARDANRMRGFPDPNPSMQVVDASGALADRGHFVAHSAGGPMDINLFPQRRDFNRGWSPRESSTDQWSDTWPIESPAESRAKAEIGPPRFTRRSRQAPPDG